MIHIRPSADRGRTQLNWLDGRHSFSFGHYYDSHHMGFGPLRVINEDIVAPGGGFAPHSHANMEIITVVLSGELAHRDSLGNGSMIRPGEVQRMSAGSGIEHSEFNASKTLPVHLLQIWIQPDRLNGPPGYVQQIFPKEQRENRLCLVISPDGREGSLPIFQNATLYITLLETGKSLTYSLAEGRRSWLQIASGAIKFNGTTLYAGDGAAIEQEKELELQASEDAEVLVFDLP